MFKIELGGTRVVELSLLIANKLDWVIEKKRKRSVDINDDRRKSKRVSLSSKEVCFFCGCKGNENLHLVTSVSVDENVKMMATELQDTVLLAKLARRDMIATDSMYHLECMNAFRSKYKSSIRGRNANQESEQEQVAEARAFAELHCKFFGAILAPKMGPNF